jgi:hypothetical protein
VRVLYFSRGYSPHDHRFLSAAVNGGHQVYFLRLERQPRVIEPRPLPAGVTAVEWEGGEAPFRWWRVPRLRSGLQHALERIRPGLVHAGPIQDCAFLVALAGFRPLLTMSWGFDLIQDVVASPLSRSAARYALRRSTYFTSDATVTRDRAVELGMDPARTCVIPWGVDLGHFRPGPERQHSAGPFTLLCNRGPPGLVSSG